MKNKIGENEHVGEKTNKFSIDILPVREAA